MRWTFALLLTLTLLLSGSVARAEEAQIPIEVDLIHGVVVTDAQFDWIRAWLREHLHADDLAGLQVDVKNRTHPGADFRAEARLASRESGTYQVQRRIRFANRKWRSYVPEESFVGDWAVEDRDVVRRIFEVGGERKVMRLDDTLSYDTVHEVLLVIARGGIDFREEDGGKYRPTVRGVWWITREKGGMIRVRSGTGMRGTWIGGNLDGERFLVTAQGMYIS